MKKNYGIVLCTKKCVRCGAELVSMWYLTVPLKNRTENKVMNGKLKEAVRCIKCKEVYNLDLFEKGLF